MMKIEEKERAPYREQLIGVIEGRCGKLLSVPWYLITTADLRAIAEGIGKKTIPLPNSWDIFQE